MDLHSISLAHANILVIEDITHEGTACKCQGFSLRGETGSLPLIPKILRPHSVGCLLCFAPPPPNTHTKKFSSPFPSCPPVYLVTDGGLHIEQIIPKVLPEVSIVRTTIMTYLKKLVGIKGQLKVEINFIFRIYAKLCPPLYHTSGQKCPFFDFALSPPPPPSGGSVPLSHKPFRKP